MDVLGIKFKKREVVDISAVNLAGLGVSNQQRICGRCLPGVKP